jgi:hypothetical protein
VSTDFASRARAILERQAPTEEDEEGEEEQEGKKGGDGEQDGGAAEEVEEDEAEAKEENLSAMKPEVWSDFLEERLDLRSYVEVPLWDVRQGAFSTHPAGDFHGQGCALPASFRDAAWDAVRKLLEECESVQGFDLTADAQGGFAGLATALAAECREECRSATVACSLLLAPPPLPTDAPPEETLFDAGGFKGAARRQLDESLAMVRLHVGTKPPLNLLGCSSASLRTLSVDGSAGARVGRDASQNCPRRPLP